MKPPFPLHPRSRQARRLYQAALFALVRGGATAVGSGLSVEGQKRGLRFQAKQVSGRPDVTRAAGLPTATGLR
ncbi:hypothetical protein [Streptacidiphilus neutrinimicus]|uniref:hypothetical protein n=1 Tax=Streptacidiphilus neutrinimicus TaxID=105420 RepID=UPI0005A97E6C|nr:hypothetical protein [Streptacidiphilus neutrinimicus]